MEINSENAGNLASEVVGSHKKRGCLKQTASFFVTEYYLRGKVSNN